MIELYHQHGTSEQFHSEIKTDMDLERLPSGKFATNALMLSLGLVAYNVLRLCGQQALAENERLPPAAKDARGKPVFRRRLRSVIADLMYLAARLTRHSHRWGLSFWRNNPWHGVWESLYERFSRRRARPLRKGEQHGERKSTISVGVREIPCAERDSQAKILRYSAFAAPAVKHLVGFLAFIFL